MSGPGRKTTSASSQAPGTRGSCNSRSGSGSRQLGFVFRTWGGKRKGAGRKPSGRRAGVSHRTRPALASRFPVHVGLRVRDDLPNLRGKTCLAAIRKAFAAGANRGTFRLVHYSVQKDHIHLVCEAAGAAALSRGMQGLCIRVARSLNKALGRKGKVFADRFFSRILRTPQETRAALNYVLRNMHRHARKESRVVDRRRLDRCSSSGFFDGWRGFGPGWHRAPGPGDPVAAPHTWLLRKGWRRHGLLNPAAAPAPHWAPSRLRD